MTALACLLAITYPASGADITFVNAYISDIRGRAVATPRAGEPFAITVVYDVRGIPNRPFKLRAKIANSESVVSEIGLSNGRFTTIPHFQGIPCLGKLPLRIDIDFEGVAGDPNPADNSFVGTFEHLSSSQPIEYFLPRRFSIRHEAVVGNFTRAPRLGYLGNRVTESWQRVVFEIADGTATKVTSDKTLQPMWEFVISNQQGQRAVIGTDTEVILSRVRVNDRLARKVSWSHLTKLADDVRVWLEPMRSTNPDAPEVRDFIKSHLPVDFKSKMSPYEAAETIYKAFIKFFRYGLLPEKIISQVEREGAPAYLTQGYGACHGFAVTLVALFKALGIPARNVSVIADITTAKGQVGQGGTAENQGQFAVAHAMGEFYLPTIGWIPFDGTVGDSACPEGEFPFGFGVLDTSKVFRTAVGSDHTYKGRYLSVSEWGSFVDAQGSDLNQYWRMNAKEVK